MPVIPMIRDQHRRLGAGEALASIRAVPCMEWLLERIRLVDSLWAAA